MGQLLTKTVLKNIVEIQVQGHRQVDLDHGTLTMYATLHSIVQWSCPRFKAVMKGRVSHKTLAPHPSHRI